MSSNSNGSPEADSMRSVPQPATAQERQLVVDERLAGDVHERFGHLRDDGSETRGEPASQERHGHVRERRRHAMTVRVPSKSNRKRTSRRPEARSA